MANLPNHLTLSMLTKGHLFSDTLTRGYLITVNCWMLTDGPTPPIPVPPIPEGGGGAGIGMEFPPYYEKIKEKIPKDEKVKEIHLRLIRQHKTRDFEIRVKLIEDMMRAKLIEDNLMSDDGFNITVEWTDI